MPRMTRTLRRRPVDSGRASAAQTSAQSSMTGGAPRRRRTGISALAVLVGGCLSACGTGLSAAAGGSATVPGPIPSGLESFYRQAVNWYPCAATDGVEKASDKTAQASASTTAATASAQATAAPSSDGAQMPQRLEVGGRGAHEERAGAAHVEGRPVHPGEDRAGLGTQQRTGRNVPGMEPRLGVDDRATGGHLRHLQRGRPVAAHAPRGLDGPTDARATTARRAACHRGLRGRLRRDGAP